MRGNQKHFHTNDIGKKRMDRTQRMRGESGIQTCWFSKSVGDRHRGVSLDSRLSLSFLVLARIDKKWAVRMWFDLMGCVSGNSHL